MTGFVTSFTTYYGTGIQGMWVTWGNTAVDKAGTIDSTTTLNIDMELRLYGLSLDSGSGDVIDATSSAPQVMEFYL